MKKSYVKPKVYFENFQLSASIASGCGVAVGHDEGKCTGNVLVNGLNLSLFFEKTCDCTPDDAGLCYQAVADDRVLFAS